MSLTLFHNIIAESWKDIAGFEDRYAISSLGNVLIKERSIIRGRGGIQTPKARIMKPYLVNGYYAVNLVKDGKPKKISIHRLIAIHFIPNPNNYPFVNHINGIKLDNRIENLEWCTPQQNIQHAHKMGLMKIGRGDSAYHKKLNTSQVEMIRKRIAEGGSLKAIAAEFNISRPTISLIKANKIWNYYVAYPI